MNIPTPFAPQQDFDVGSLYAGTYLKSDDLGGKTYPATIVAVERVEIPEQDGSVRPKAALTLKGWPAKLLLNKTLGCVPVQPAAPKSANVPDGASEPSRRHSPGVGGATGCPTPPRAPAADSAARRPSPKERRQLIANRLRATPEQSDRRIAREVGSDHKTVGRVRREITGLGNSPTAGNQVADVGGLLE